jgi:hypothetical protein
MQTMQTKQTRRSGRGAGGRTGIALVPAILIVAGLAVFTVALLSAVLSGSRTVVHQNEEYQVSSAVESVAALAAENLWSEYVAQQGGAAGDIESFRVFLSGRAIEDAGEGGLPRAAEGKDLLPDLALPEQEGHPRFNHVNLDAVRLVRRDVEDATQLFLTVSASTTRGEGLVNPVLNRAVQQVYTVEPADFPGFEYALLANNVNCIFCHARIDNAERWWSQSPDERFARVKVGTLESLMLRHNMDGAAAAINDFDADSYIAGALYVRGLAATSDGSPISNWNALSFKNHPFDEEGNILPPGSFGLDTVPFSPAPNPPVPFENLYLDYALGYADQVDGYLPNHFPPPFTDDGGVDPLTGEFDSAAAGNKRIDDSEFLEVAADAQGEITAGIVNVTAPGEVIDTALAYNNAIFQGNTDALRSAETGGQGIQGNVVLTGKPNNPIWIEGKLAIDGDLVIQGVVKGSGSLYVRGNIYVPADLMYADGHTYLPGDAPGHPTGPRTFGIAQDGTKNALALTAGGNILIGDYQRPATVQPNGTRVEPGTLEIVNGNPSDDWNFALAEMALFNRTEWARTQPTLPGANGAVVQNPSYLEGYVPRYYGYGEDSIIPIYNKRGLHFDPATGTWLGFEVATSWDPAYLTYADPNNPSDPILFHPDGTPRAVTSTISHTDGWMDPNVYKLSVEYFESRRPQQTPMQIDGLLYTSNAIFGIVNRNTAYAGMMVMNGSIVAADLGMLVPGLRDPDLHFSNHSPVGKYAIGLQLNYDVRLKHALDINNPLQVQLKRTYWNPTANLL